MAEGRMLKKVIADSEKLSLCSDKAKVLYFMMLPHLDIKGRLYANPTIIKGQYTTMIGYSDKTIQRCLEELHNVRGQEVNDGGLIILYRVDGKQYLEYTRFEDFQTLNPKKEAESRIPSPTPENSGERQRTPLKDKISKVKIREVKTTAAGIVFDFKKGAFDRISEENLKEWAAANPAVDIRLDLKQATLWVKDNPDKRKSKWGRFLTNWFKRTQERGGNRGKSDVRVKQQEPSRVCVIDKSTDCCVDSQGVILCGECRDGWKRIRGRQGWGNVPKDVLERVVGEGKALLKNPPGPKGKDEELVQQDKIREQVKSLAGDMAEHA